MISAPGKLGAYLRLIRFDKPIGTVLVLMPTLWSLWISSAGRPSLKSLLVFTGGCFLMRSAGCIANDLADRRFDRLVERTRSRPLATGEINSGEAVLLFLLLSAVAFLLVLQLNRMTVYLSGGGLVLAILYPFSKRWISLPQFVLGISFGWGALMASASVDSRIGLPAFLIFAANIFWSLAYDTIYALMDRKDDLKIGVNSAAILFGRRVALAVGIFLALALLLLGWAGYLARRHAFYFCFLGFAGLAFGRQAYGLAREDPERLAFSYFKSHGYIGSFILLGIAGDYLLNGA